MPIHVRNISHSNIFGHFQNNTYSYESLYHNNSLYSTMMLSDSHLLAGNGTAPRAQAAELKRSRPAVIMSPPPPRPPTSTSTSTSRHSNVLSSAPLFDAVVSAFFEQLRHSVADFSESQHWRMVGGWQAQGIPDEVIYDTLQTLFPFHGAPLTLYEEIYLPALSGKGLTPIRQTKPPLATTDIAIQQRQRKKSTQQRLRKTPQLPSIATTPRMPIMYPKPPPAPGMLHQLLNPQQSWDPSTNNNNSASIVINVGDYVNVRASSSQWRGGNGYVACKETIVNGNDIDFVFTVAYVDAFLSGGQSLSATESKITRDRLTVLPPSRYFALGNPKQGQGIVTAAPIQQPPEIQPPKIPINLLAVQKLAPAPFTEGRYKRKGSTVTTQSSKEDDDVNDNHEHTNMAVVYGSPSRLSGHENLAEYLQKNHSLHRAKGWRQDDFADVDLGAASVKRELLLQDVMWMEEYLNEKGRRKGPKQAKGDSFNSNSFVRNNKNKSSNNDDDNDDNGRSEKIHPLTMRYLAYSWGIGKNTPKELLKRANVHSVGAAAPRRVGSSTNNAEVWKQKSVIECRKTALKHYSAKHLYIRHRITERRRLSTNHELEKYNMNDKDDEDSDNDDDNDDASASGSFLTFQYRKDTKEEWDALDRAAREPWEQKAKWHDEMQPSVQQILVGQINNHPYRTYNDLAIDIGDWCGASTIQRWLTAKRAASKVE
jgi:hypothetical protein